MTALKLTPYLTYLRFKLRFMPAVIGPVLMGGVGLLVRSMGHSSDIASRSSITSISMLFIVGGSLFYFVDEERAKEEVKYLARKA